MVTVASLLNPVDDGDSHFGHHGSDSHGGGHGYDSHGSSHGDASPGDRYGGDEYANPPRKELTSTPLSNMLPPSPSLTSCTTERCETPLSSTPTTTTVTRKAKLIKDAPLFIKGKIKGPIRYPPHETFDAETLDLIAEFDVYPLGSIGEYRRHIPYHSDKKTFWEKTGRGAFEVFQYTFKVPNEPREYTVMWDYNVGLVRITPFFKSCKYTKTAPAKMLNCNPGLREICHSITGGALAAQGYWMPFAAAKAVAITFCHPIRFALLPLFGPDFAAQCIEPTMEEFGDMAIDPDIVRHCTEEALRYRADASDASPETITAMEGAEVIDVNNFHSVKKTLKPRDCTPHASEMGDHSNELLTPISGHSRNTSLDDAVPAKRTRRALRESRQDPPRSVPPATTAPATMAATLKKQTGKMLAEPSSDSQGDHASETSANEPFRASTADGFLNPYKRAREEDHKLNPADEKKAAWALVQLHLNSMIQPVRGGKRRRISA